MDAPGAYINSRTHTPYLRFGTTGSLGKEEQPHFFRAPPQTPTTTGLRAHSPPDEQHVDAQVYAPDAKAFRSEGEARHAPAGFTSGAVTRLKPFPAGVPGLLAMPVERRCAKSCGPGRCFDLPGLEGVERETCTNPTNS